ncbi:hypothetical protein FISHEDRAFT_45812 [Fistulina hepatica ATCC 64428]|uniref:Uncharacterized protein n=1 Tax=Fistulina hepatica ATCC 64428 TaxID=1128425 RepID=A0A0D7A9X0_9AGAR|nr:hypothetical protein FISHEDRAFT_45812 [Fistulina hepatica ATCC 64428]
MATFDLDIAQLTALFMESVIYGALRCLLWSTDGGSTGCWKFRQSVNHVMLSSTVAMFLIGTLDLAIGLRENIVAFIYFQNGGNPEASFENVAHWMSVTKMATYVCQTMIGDAILIYRAFIIWGRKWCVIVPSMLLWIVCTACGMIIMHIEATMNSDGDLATARLSPFITSMLSLTLGLNLLTTLLIIIRIWSIKTELYTNGGAVPYERVVRQDPFMRVMRMLIESGLLYTVSVVVLFATYLADNNAFLGVSDSIVQIIGISFTLIIIRADNNTRMESSLANRIPSMGGAVVSGVAVPMQRISIKRHSTSVEHSHDSLPNPYVDSPIHSPRSATYATHLSESWDRVGWFCESTRKEDGDGEV